MSKKLTIILSSFVLGVSAIAISVYAGMSGGGPINVNDKIETSNATAVETGTAQINTNTQATQPNGGLRGKGKSAAPAPTPEPVPEPTTENASSTPAESDDATEAVDETVE